MNLSHDDRQRLWRALASYIDECRTLSEHQDEPEFVSYCQVEIEEARELRSRLNIRE